MTPSKSLRPGTLGRAWLGTVATNAAILLSGIATGVLAARLLGPEDRGLLAAVFFWPQTIATAATLSLGDALIARRHGTSSPPARLVASANAASLSCALLGALVGLPLLPWLLGPERGSAIDLAIAYFLAYLPVLAIDSVLFANDQAEQRFRRFNLLRLGPSWIYLAGIGVLWVLDAVGVASLLWATWVGAAATVAARLWFARGSLLVTPSFREAVELTKLGARFHVGSLLALLATQADRMALFRLFDDVTAGHYVVAATFASSGLAVATSAVAFVLLPALAAEPDRARARATLALALRRTALFLYVGVTGSLLVTPWLLPLLFGHAFADAVPPALLLLIAVVPLTLRQTIVRCLRAFGEARIGVTSELATLLGFAVAAAGLLGAGTGGSGLAAATIVGNAAGLAVCVRHLHIRHAIPAAAWLFPGWAIANDGSLQLRSPARPPTTG